MREYVTVDKLAEAVLYEGFLLYPYRPSLKNTRRWTFGGLFPSAFCDSQPGVEAARLKVECLIEGTKETCASVSLRFLRLIDRRPGRFKQPLVAWPHDAAAQIEWVESLQVDGREWFAWQEAAEHKLEMEDIALSGLTASPRRQTCELSGNTECEPACDADDRYVGVIERTRRPLTVKLELSAVQISDGCFRLSFTASNDTSRSGIAPQEAAGGQCLPYESGGQCPPYTRDEAALEACVAAHVVISVCGGELVSQFDPPERFRHWAAANKNVGVWPVLVGMPPDRSTMLAAPIILYDYPQIAPESRAAFFDSTEIDEMLSLRIMTLTDDEKQAMRSLDPRGRLLLETVESLSPADLAELHGTDRGPRRADTPLSPGDRVRLAPRKGGDLFDLFLAGKTATITSIEEDFDGRRHFAVVLDDDPGRDLGEQLQVGHRFFFQAEEIEPLDQPLPANS